MLPRLEALMPGTIGPLLPSDERFDHQIVDTFATVAQTDLAWTEKVCGMACAKDGSLQLGFGFGKYTNRNVMDAYGGISRGVEQRTVRASRRLSPDPETMRIGPLSYQVIEPLRKVRVRLEPTQHQPIAFDLLFEGAVPCFIEDREDWRVPHGYRQQAHQIRYHQTGTGSGWSRSRASARRSRPTPGSRRAITRGACGPMSASRRRTSSTATGRRAFPCSRSGTRC
jgi:hypothetical protein